MFKLLTILWNSFRMALQELRVNKLRTFLSLFGITIGIFCIIGVLATVDSLKNNVQSQIKALGTNSIWIDKFDYNDGGKGGFAWWKYYKRPSNRYSEMQFLKANLTQAKNVAYFVPNSVTAEYESTSVQNVPLYGVTEDFYKIQDLKISEGRFISDAEFTRGSPVCVIGAKQAENIFGIADASCIGKQISMNGRKVTIVGLIEKRGTEGIGFQFDNCLLISYQYFASLFDVLHAGQNLIIVEGKDNVSKQSLIDEIRGYMRQLRKLSPQEEDNFALNDIQLFSQVIDQMAGSINIAGWFIAGLSLLVGAFGVANIMFVTVRERTSQIGLKKAIGAKRRTILTEFLLESAFLCVIGGLLGLFFVWLLTLFLSSIMPFPIFIAGNIIVMAMSICVVLGVLAGIIPAFIAARMDPVVAIRSK
ncbi:MAG: ABC transporter permease [Bacteroidetes bacterium]|nr:ABC transporter permease [Bacteroidota bacterium]MBS1648245.1 ABC transporter permease [Bacteroidota bacterium]